MKPAALVDVALASSGGPAAEVRRAEGRARATGEALAVDRAEAVRRARTALAPSLSGRQAPAYPVAALGPLAAACEAIATAGQVQPAMVGQCLLGSASLLTQGLFNVETLAGSRPLSLYLLTLGDSGDGKSTAQGAALAPITDWQRGVAKRYSAELKDLEKARGTRKHDGDPTEVPACPFRLVGDATVEGLRRDLDGGVCSQGVFTDEAAAILSGYGMSADHRSKTAGVFSKLWDAGHLSVSRATGGRVERYGRRVALHWLIQPMAASEAIGDPLLAALGFWPRFLTAWPAPQAPRLALAFRPETLPTVGAYWQRCNELLTEPLPDDAGNCPMLPLADGAHALLGKAFEGFERAARHGELQAVKPFALRASEQACRVAGVMSAFDGSTVVSADAMRGALALVAYSLKTWQVITDEGAADQRGAFALRLFEWLAVCWWVS
ncbi:MAG: DUF3987 domain-containing protein [Methylibium sp.]